MSKTSRVMASITMARRADDQRRSVNMI